MEADLDLFERPTARLREAIEARLGAIAAFLGYRELRIRDVPTVVPNRPTGAAPARVTSARRRGPRRRARPCVARDRRPPEA